MKKALIVGVLIVAVQLPGQAQARRKSMVSGQQVVNGVKSRIHDGAAWLT